jgi:HTH-type transcriptional regulator / antitoxin HigA
MIQTTSTIKTWESFYAHLKPISSQAEYTQMLEFTADLIVQHNTDLEPHRSLWRLVAGYLLEWEKAHEVGVAPSQPFELLRFQMQQHGLSQYQLAKEGLVSQSYLSKILRGEREMGKKLARVFANRFGLPTGFFL